MILEGIRLSLILGDVRKEYWFKEKTVFPPQISLLRMAGFWGAAL